jgi:hypothetical protein
MMVRLQHGADRWDLGRLIGEITNEHVVPLNRKPRERSFLMQKIIVAPTAYADFISKD